MSLGTMASAWYLLGLLGIAGGLFALQRLRTRHRRLRVVTTIFWREAAEEARARVLVRRFRHPWAYALVLAIAALLWTAVAGPEPTGRGERDWVVLLDASAHAAAAGGGRLEADAARVEEILADLPRGARRVVLCAGTPRTLLRPGEHESLFRVRLREQLAPGRMEEAEPSELPVPQACPETVSRTLLELGAAGRPLTVLIAGGAPLSRELLDALPGTLRVERLGAAESRIGENRGVVALGASPAVSGAADRVDVYAEILGPGLAAPPSATLAGRLLAAPDEIERGAERMVLGWRDLPARGEAFVLTLPPGDANGADDRAALALPTRRFLRVALEPGLPGVVEAALRADPGVVLVPAGEAELVVRSGGSSLAGSLPALEIVSGADQREAFLLVHEEGLDSERVLLDTFSRLGLDEIDAVDLAESSGRDIEVGAVPGPLRRIGVLGELLSDRYDFAQSRSFPLFVGTGLRWLAGVEPQPASAAAGRVVRHAPGGPWREGAALVATAGDDFVPPAAAAYETASGDRVLVSLLDEEVTAPPVGVALDRASALPGADLDPTLWAALLALGLLALEWFLHRTGRMP